MQFLKFCQRVNTLREKKNESYDVTKTESKIPPEITKEAKFKSTL